MKNNDFIGRMGNDWTTKKKSKKNSNNWFFSDFDGDGVMNGIDCNPYNKNEQDLFIDLQKAGKFAAGAINSGVQGAQTFATNVVKTVVPVRPVPIKPISQPPKNLKPLSKIPSFKTTPPNKDLYRTTSTGKTYVVPKKEHTVISKNNIRIVNQPTTVRDVHGNKLNIEYVNRDTNKSVTLNQSNGQFYEHNADGSSHLLKPTHTVAYANDVNEYNLEIRDVSHNYRNGVKNNVQRIPTPFKDEIKQSDNNISYIEPYWGKFVSPSGKNLRSNEARSGDFRLYPETLHNRYENLYDSGVNRDNIMAMQRVDDSGYVADSEQQNIVAVNAYKYAKDKNINVERSTEYNPDLNYGEKGMAGANWIYLKNKINIGKDSTGQKDENAILLHEISHAQDTYSGVGGGPVSNRKELQNIYDNNMVDLSSNLYKDIRENPYAKDQLLGEVKAQYIGAYYSGHVRKNKVVDDFELGLNTKSKIKGNATISDVVKSGNVFTEVAGRLYKQKK